MCLIITILTIIIGIIAGYFAFKIFNKKIHGPNSNIVKKTIHKNNGKCYVFEPHLYLCGDN
ncbi:hypothetical protein BMW23_0688 [Bodo saltans virus]|uniref:Uncharacterized protein n=1 Tax=Bodo saltans virus TaxID=2024608 RepID=A0A2H4UV47_9VIRU|nr:hypothetical protein QJ851_gp0671 [Bodo saltans virus]ATZ80734.1 hypothetical protein BMW23_0688 [Bodo saltans virus]